MAYMGGAIAASAAEAEKRRQMLHAEEENMTQYTQEDLTDDWEFKIVRSGAAAFRKPEHLDRLIEEEARAGWVMLEKFDNTRIRFKRPRSARTQDYLLSEGIDPYRTQYGVFGNPQVVMVVVGLIISVLLGLAALGLFLGRRAMAIGGTMLDGAPIIAPLIVGVLVFVMLLVVILKQRLR